MPGAGVEANQHEARDVPTNISVCDALTHFLTSTPRGPDEARRL
jgi:hypothetical protein